MAALADDLAGETGFYPRKCFEYSRNAKLFERLALPVPARQGP